MAKARAVRDDPPAQEPARVPPASNSYPSQESLTRAEALAATLADAMASSWRRGIPTGAEAILDKHPEVADCPEAAVRLIYEEVLLRRERGDGTTRQRIQRRNRREISRTETDGGKGWRWPISDGCKGRLGFDRRQCEFARRIQF